VPLQDHFDLITKAIPDGQLPMAPPSAQNKTPHSASECGVL
jgi:hypothetical protein